MKKMLKEFKEFISQGNVFELAVAVIIGRSFGNIITSLVNDIIMPTIGILIGGLDFSELSITVGSSVIKYGQFLQAALNFLIISASLFIFIKAFYSLESMIKHEDKKEVKNEDTVLLTEIRNALIKEKIPR